MTEFLAFLARNDLDGRAGGPSFIWSFLSVLGFLLLVLILAWVVRALK
jgi:hypothetical protein